MTNDTLSLMVNGDLIALNKPFSAFNLIKKLGYQNQRIALEVNEFIVPKSQYPNFVLNDGDKVEIIKAVGGG